MSRAEIAARIAESGFDKLKTRIRRVSTLDVPVPYSPPLEAHIGPSESRIMDAVQSGGRVSTVARLHRFPDDSHFGWQKRTPRSSSISSAACGSSGLSKKKSPLFTPNARSSVYPSRHRSRSRRGGRLQLVAQQMTTFSAAIAPTATPSPKGPILTGLWRKSPAVPPATAAARADRCTSSLRKPASSQPPGVVGGTIPLALGAAFAAKEKKKGQVALVFFGDGAGQAGPFHESLNIASLWRLPVIFVCENNGYAEFTPLSAHTKVERLAQHAKTYAIPASTVDGNDLFAVREAMSKAVENCRAGKGPIFVECLTHRMRGHYEGDPAKYRELSQLAEWKKKDPIGRLVRLLKSKKAITDKKLEAIEKEARDLVEKAAQFSLSSPWPAPNEVDTQVTA